MEILVAKGVPVAPLRTTFRAHPGLNDLPNSLFYEGTLVSGTPAADRPLLLDRFSLPNPSVPFLFIDVSGTSVRAANGSHSNATEANTCRELVTALLSKNIPPESIAIITLYKEQFRVMERFAGQHQIDLHTVDSVQGREQDIVILLTTRTSIQVDRAEFLDDPLRMNVAITRCRHGQFVLGNATALSPLQNWGRLIQWATALNTVVSTTTLPNILE